MTEIVDLAKNVFIPKLGEALEKYEADVEHSCLIVKELYDTHFVFLESLKQTMDTLKKSKTYKASIGVAAWAPKLKCSDNKKVMQVIFAFTFLIYQAALNIDDKAVQNTIKDASMKGIMVRGEKLLEYHQWLLDDLSNKL